MGKIEANITKYLIGFLANELERIEVEDGKDGFFSANEQEEAKKVIASLMDVKNSHPVIQSLSAINLKKLLVELRIALRENRFGDDSYKSNCFESYEKMYPVYQEMVNPSTSHEGCMLVEKFFKRGILLILNQSTNNFSVSLEPTFSEKTEVKGNSGCCWGP